MKTKTLSIFLGACAAVIIAHSDLAMGEEVFRCQVNGKTVFQDSSCDAKGGGATGLKYTPPSDTELRARASRQQQQANIQAELGAREQAASVGQVRIGQSAEQVLRAWGRPRSINTTVVSGRTSEQLVYGNGRYVYVTNGVVTGIQASDRLEQPPTSGSQTFGRL